MLLLLGRCIVTTLVIAACVANCSVETVATEHDRYLHMFTLTVVKLGYRPQASKDTMTWDIHRTTPLVPHA